jgi:hypothetical protein
MKRLPLIAAIALLLPIFSFGQSIILYRETFPFEGITSDLPIGPMGWANDIPDNPDRVYQNSGGAGAVFAYEASSATTAFYTSTNLTQTAGTPFPAINTALYSGITLSADIEPYQTPANITARLAVQMNGANWFVSATPLPVPTPAARLRPIQVCSTQAPRSGIR